MTWRSVLGYLGAWSGIGCALFVVYVVVVSRTGLVYTARKQDGTLKEQIPLSGYLNMLILLLCIVGLQVAANYFGLARKALDISLSHLFLLNLGHYLILFAFDTAVIDGLVLGVWRPAFLRLPDAMGGESMKKHALASIPVGVVAGLVLTVISTAISYLTLFRS
jgi:Na+-transporting NADH:ubiquinone oxidoreductase subunit NqrE